MFVKKLTIGTFIPKKLGLKNITVINPKDSTVREFLSIASRTQRQEALEAALTFKRTPVQKGFMHINQTTPDPCLCESLPKSPISAKNFNKRAADNINAQKAFENLNHLDQTTPRASSADSIIFPSRFEPESLDYFS